MANIYEVIDGIVERNLKALTSDVRDAMGSKAHADIAVDYMDTLAYQIKDEIKTYLRAYKDFSHQ